jgi:hypothetical protein
MQPLSRRRFLRAGGVCLALPLLESSSRAMPAPVYSVFVRQGNGVTQEDVALNEEERFWLSNSNGALSTASMEADSDRVLSELSYWADELTVVKGMDFAFSGAFCGHAGGGNQVLTATRPTEHPAVNHSLATGESVDNRIARAFSNNGGEPLTLYTGPRRNHLEEVLSYRGSRDRRAAEDDPWNAYKRMLGPADLDALVFERRQSVNDLVLDQIHTLMGDPKLSSTDVERLELHFDSVRDFEALACRLQEDEEQVMASLSGQGVLNKNRLLFARMHMDLIVLSFGCDHSRAATLQIGDGNDGTQYTVDGEVLPNFHWISHRITSDGDSGDFIAGAADMHHAIDRLFANTFDYLLTRLAEAGLLEQSVAVWCNDLGNGVSHSYVDVPFIIGGGGGGLLRKGNAFDFGGQSHHLLLNTFCQLAGVTEDDGSPHRHFGEDELPEGVLDDLLA